MYKTWYDVGRVFYLLLLSHPGEHTYREARALAYFALDRNTSTHQRTQLLTERQPKAGATILAGSGAIGLTEILEQPSDIGLRDADAGILNLDLDPVSRLTLAPLDRECDHSVMSKFRCVTQKIEHRLPKLGLICRDNAKIRWALDDELVLVFSHHGPDGGNHLLHHLTEIEPLDFQFDMIGFDFRKIEHVGHKRQ